VQRVVIIGSGGSGKSTLARQLGAITGLAVIHLDVEHWRPGWVEPPTDAWAARVAELARGDRWIMDGNYGGTMEVRFQAADTIILLDLPRRTCLRRIIWRRIRYHRQSRPDMAEGCYEQLDWAFLKWVWGYPKRRRPAIFARLRELEAEKRVVILNSPRAVRRFLDDTRRTIENDSATPLRSAGK